MERRILRIEPAALRWQVEMLQVESLEKDPREEYLVLSGEPLCQYLLRRDPDALIIARGPTPFLTGNKATVGYISPLTGLPHYSYVGGRVAAQLFNLGLDAIAFTSPHPRSADLPIVTVGGRVPSLALEFREHEDMPSGQRGAFYWLVDTELNGDAKSGSVLTLGDGAYLGRRTWPPRASITPAEAARELCSLAMPRRRCCAESRWGRLSSSERATRASPAIRIARSRHPSTSTVTGYPAEAAGQSSSCTRQGANRRARTRSPPGTHETSATRWPMPETSAS